MLNTVLLEAAVFLLLNHLRGLVEDKIGFFTHFTVPPD
jgi:hypothetical protein